MVQAELEDFEIILSGCSPGWSPEKGRRVRSLWSVFTVSQFPIQAAKARQFPSTPPSNGCCLRQFVELLGDNNPRCMARHEQALNSSCSKLAGSCSGLAYWASIEQVSLIVVVNGQLPARSLHMRHYMYCAMMSTWYIILLYRSMSFIVSSISPAEKTVSRISFANAPIIHEIWVRMNSTALLPACEPSLIAWANPSSCDASNDSPEDF